MIMPMSADGGSAVVAAVANVAAVVQAQATAAAGKVAAVSAASVGGGVAPIAQAAAGMAQAVAQAARAAQLEAQMQALMRAIQAAQEQARLAQAAAAHGNQMRQAQQQTREALRRTQEQAQTQSGSAQALGLGLELGIGHGGGGGAGGVRGWARAGGNGWATQVLDGDSKTAAPGASPPHAKPMQVAKGIQDQDKPRSATPLEKLLQLPVAPAPESAPARVGCGTTPNQNVNNTLSALASGKNIGQIASERGLSLQEVISEADRSGVKIHWEYTQGDVQLTRVRQGDAQVTYTRDYQHDRFDAEGSYIDHATGVRKEVDAWFEGNGKTSQNTVRDAQTGQSTSTIDAADGTRTVRVEDAYGRPLSEVTTVSGAASSYEVKAGDTLTAIHQQQSQLGWEQFLQANGITDADQVRPGQMLAVNGPNSRKDYAYMPDGQKIEISTDSSGNRRTVLTKADGRQTTLEGTATLQEQRTAAVRSGIFAEGLSVKDAAARQGISEDEALLALQSENVFREAPGRANKQTATLTIYDPSSNMLVIERRGPMNEFKREVIAADATFEVGYNPATGAREKTTLTGGLGYLHQRAEQSQSRIDDIDRSLSSLSSMNHGSRLDRELQDERDALLQQQTGLGLDSGIAQGQAAQVFLSRTAWQLEDQAALIVQVLPQLEPEPGLRTQATQELGDTVAAIGSITKGLEMSQSGLKELASLDDLYQKRQVAGQAENQLRQEFREWKNTTWLYGGKSDEQIRDDLAHGVPPPEKDAFSSPEEEDRITWQQFERWQQDADAGGPPPALRASARDAWTARNAANDDLTKAEAANKRAHIENSTLRLYQTGADARALLEERQLWQRENPEVFSRQFSRQTELDSLERQHDELQIDILSTGTALKNDEQLLARPLPERHYTEDRQKADKAYAEESANDLSLVNTQEMIKRLGDGQSQRKDADADAFIKGWIERHPQEAKSQGVQLFVTGLQTNDGPLRPVGEAAALGATANLPGWDSLQLALQLKSETWQAARQSGRELVEGIDREHRDIGRDIEKHSMLRDVASWFSKDASYTAQDFTAGKRHEAEQLKGQIDRGDISVATYYKRQQELSAGYARDSMGYRKNALADDEMWGQIDDAVKTTAGLITGIAVGVITKNPLAAIAAAKAVMGTLDAVDDGWAASKGRSITADGRLSWQGWAVKAATGKASAADHKLFAKTELVNWGRAASSVGGVSAGARVALLMRAGGLAEKLGGRALTGAAVNTVQQGVDGAGNLATDALDLAIDGKLGSEDGRERMRLGQANFWLGMGFAPLSGLASGALPLSAGGLLKGAAMQFANEGTFSVAQAELSSWWTQGRWATKGELVATGIGMVGGTLADLVTHPMAHHGHQEGMGGGGRVDTTPHAIPAAAPRPDTLLRDVREPVRAARTDGGLVGAVPPSGAGSHRRDVDAAGYALADPARMTEQAWWQTLRAIYDAGGELQGVRYRVYETPPREAHAARPIEFETGLPGTSESRGARSRNDPVRKPEWQGAAFHDFASFKEAQQSIFDDVSAARSFSVGILHGATLRPDGSAPAQSVAAVVAVNFTPDKGKVSVVVQHNPSAPSLRVAHPDGYVPGQPLIYNDVDGNRVDLLNRNGDHFLPTINVFRRRPSDLHVPIGSGAPAVVEVPVPEGAFAVTALSARGVAGIEGHLFDSDGRALPGEQVASLIAQHPGYRGQPVIVYSPMAGDGVVSLIQTLSKVLRNSNVYGVTEGLRVQASPPLPGAPTTLVEIAPARGDNSYSSGRLEAKRHDALPIVEIQSGPETGRQSRQTYDDIATMGKYRFVRAGLDLPIEAGEARNAGMSPWFDDMVRQVSRPGGNFCEIRFGDAYQLGEDVLNPTGSQTNCLNASVAWDMAMSSPGTRLGALPSGFKSIDQVDAIYGVGDEALYGRKDEALAALARLPEGSRGFIRVGDGELWHMVNFLRQDGRTMIIDNQAGRLVDDFASSQIAIKVTQRGDAPEVDRTVLSGNRLENLMELDDVEAANLQGRPAAGMRARGAAGGTIDKPTHGDVLPVDTAVLAHEPVTDADDFNVRYGAVHELWVGGINPAGSQTNCVNVAVAADIAMGNPGVSMSALPSLPKEGRQLEALYGQDWSLYLNRDDALADLDALPDGSRGFVQLGRGLEQPAHMVNFVREAGNTRIIDHQQGRYVDEFDGRRIYVLVSHRGGEASVDSSVLAGSKLAKLMALSGTDEVAELAVGHTAGHSGIGAVPPESSSIVEFRPSDWVVEDLIAGVKSMLSGPHRLKNVEFALYPKPYEGYIGLPPNIRLQGLKVETRGMTEVDRLRAYEATGSAPVASYQTYDEALSAMCAMDGQSAGIALYVKDDSQDWIPGENILGGISPHAPDRSLFQFNTNFSRSIEIEMAGMPIDQPSFGVDDSTKFFVRQEHAGVVEVPVSDARVQLSFQHAAAQRARLLAELPSEVPPIDLVSIQAWMEKFGLRSADVRFVPPGSPHEAYCLGDISRLGRWDPMLRICYVRTPVDADPIGVLETHIVTVHELLHANSIPARHAYVRADADGLKIEMTGGFWKHEKQSSLNVGQAAEEGYAIYKSTIYGREQHGLAAGQTNQYEERFLAFRTSDGFVRGTHMAVVLERLVECHREVGPMLDLARYNAAGDAMLKEYLGDDLYRDIFLCGDAGFSFDYTQAVYARIGSSDDGVYTNFNVYDGTRNPPLRAGTEPRPADLSYLRDGDATMGGAPVDATKIKVAVDVRAFLVIARCTRFPDIDSLTADIQAHPDYRPGQDVVLGVCFGGRNSADEVVAPDSVAHQLADRLGSRVQALKGQLTLGAENELDVVDVVVALPQLPLVDDSAAPQQVVRQGYWFNRNGVNRVADPFGSAMRSQGAHIGTDPIDPLTLGGAGSHPAPPEGLPGITNWDEAILQSGRLLSMKASPVPSVNDAALFDAVVDAGEVFVVSHSGPGDALAAAAKGVQAKKKISFGSYEEAVEAAAKLGGAWVYAGVPGAQSLPPASRGRLEASEIVGAIFVRQDRSAFPFAFPNGRFEARGAAAVGHQSATQQAVNLAALSESQQSPAHDSAPQGKQAIAPSTWAGVASNLDTGPQPPRVAPASTQNVTTTNPGPLPNAGAQAHQTGQNTDGGPAGVDIDKLIETGTSFADTRPSRGAADPSVGGPGSRPAEAPDAVEQVAEQAAVQRKAQLAAELETAKTQALGQVRQHIGDLAANAKSRATEALDRAIADGEAKLADAGRTATDRGHARVDDEATGFIAVRAKGDIGKQAKKAVDDATPHFKPDAADHAQKALGRIGKDATKAEREALGKLRAAVKNGPPEEARQRLDAAVEAAKSHAKTRIDAKAAKELEAASRQIANQAKDGANAITRQVDAASDQVITRTQGEVQQDIARAVQSAKQDVDGFVDRMAAKAAQELRGHTRVAHKTGQQQIDAETTAATAAAQDKLAVNANDAVNQIRAEMTTESLAALASRQAKVQATATSAGKAAKDKLADASSDAERTAADAITQRGEAAKTRLNQDVDQLAANARPRDAAAEIREALKTARSDVRKDLLDQAKQLGGKAAKDIADEASRAGAEAKTTIADKGDAVNDQSVQETLVRARVLGLNTARQVLPPGGNFTQARWSEASADMPAIIAEHFDAVAGKPGAKALVPTAEDAAIMARTQAKPEPADPSKPDNVGRYYVTGKDRGPSSITYGVDVPDTEGFRAGLVRGSRITGGTGLKGRRLASYATFGEAQKAAQDTGGGWVHLAEPNAAFKPLNKRAWVSSKEIMASAYVHGDGQVLPVAIPNVHYTGWADLVPKANTTLAVDPSHGPWPKNLKAPAGYERNDATGMLEPASPGKPTQSWKGAASTLLTSSVMLGGTIMAVKFGVPWVVGAFGGQMTTKVWTYVGLGGFTYRANVAGIKGGWKNGFLNRLRELEDPGLDPATRTKYLDQIQDRMTGAKGAMRGIPKDERAKVPDVVDILRGGPAYQQQLALDQLKGYAGDLLSRKSVVGMTQDATRAGSFGGTGVRNVVTIGELSADAVAFAKWSSRQVLGAIGSWAGFAATGSKYVPAALKGGESNRFTKALAPISSLGDATSLLPLIATDAITAGHAFATGQPLHGTLATAMVAADVWLTRLLAVDYLDDMRGIKSGPSTKRVIPPMLLLGVAAVLLGGAAIGSQLLPDENQAAPGAPGASSDSNSQPPLSETPPPPPAGHPSTETPVVVESGDTVESIIKRELDRLLFPSEQQVLIKQGGADKVKAEALQQFVNLNPSFRFDISKIDGVLSGQPGDPDYIDVGWKFNVDRFQGGQTTRGVK